MNNMKTACYCLLASAFILGAMIIVKAGQYVDNSAYAEMVVTKGNITVLTTQVKSDAEMLFVLDSKNDRLLGYLFDINRRNIELVSTLDIAQQIQRGLGKSGSRPGKTDQSR